MTHYVADVTKARDAARLRAEGPARRRDQALRRVVPRPGGPSIRRRRSRSSRIPTGPRATSLMASSSPPAPRSPQADRALRPDCVGQDGRRRRSYASTARGGRHLGRLGGALPRPADHHRCARLSGAARRDRPAQRRRLGRRVPAAGRTLRSTTRRSRCSSGERACTSARPSRRSSCRRRAEPGRRAHWQAEYDRLGSAAAHEELTRVDPAAAARVHANDRKRVVRALELAETGASLAPEHDRLWTEELRVDDLDRGARPAARSARRPDRAADARDGGRGSRRRGAARVVGRALGHRAQGARARAVRDPARAPGGRGGRRSRRAGSRATSASGCDGCPGVVTLPANRPAEEVADEIVALAGAGERLPRH